MKAEATKRVARGAAWLDEVSPGWEHKISFQDLDMGSTCQCVLGQVFVREAAVAEQVQGGGWLPGYVWAEKNLFPAHGITEDELLGFDHTDCMVNECEGGYGCEHAVTYDELREAWESLVKGRFDTGTLSG